MSVFEKKLRKKVRKHATTRSQQESKPFYAKSIIGWREWVSLPDLDISQIKVKVDTGAKTSSLHAEEMERFLRKGRPWVRFQLYPMQRSHVGGRKVELEVIDERRIRSSNGQVEKRPVVQTNIHFCGRTWPIELTLSNRDLMGFRMLLGREAIHEQFIVDVSHSFLASKLRKKKRSSK